MTTTRIKLKDADADVRRRIADRPNLPDEVVSTLAADANADVRRRIADRPQDVQFIEGEWHILMVEAE